LKAFDERRDGAVIDEIPGSDVDEGGEGVEDIGVGLLDLAEELILIVS
jgi:hypothetical protein